VRTTWKDRWKVAMESRRQCQEAMELIQALALAMETESKERQVTPEEWEETSKNIRKIAEAHCELLDHEDLFGDE